eukprot:g82013.t1
MPATKTASKQEKAFLNWINAELGEGSCISLDQLSNGVLILKLAEKVIGKKAGKYHKKPRGRFQKLENINKFLALLKEGGFDVSDVNPSDLEEKDSKILLSLLWRMMYRLEGSDGKDGKGGQVTEKLNRQKTQAELMSWAQTASGSPVSFPESFKDGKTLAGLVNGISPGSIDAKTIQGMSPLDVTKLALKVAEEKYGVKATFTADELIQGGDKQALIDYLSKLRQAGVVNKMKQQQQNAPTRAPPKNPRALKRRSVTSWGKTSLGKSPREVKQFKLAPSPTARVQQQQMSSPRVAPPRPAATSPRPRASSIPEQELPTQLRHRDSFAMTSRGEKARALSETQGICTCISTHAVAMTEIVRGRRSTTWTEQELMEILEASDNNVDSAKQLLVKAKDEAEPKSFGNLLNKWKFATGNSEDSVVSMLTDRNFTKNILKGGRAFTAEEARRFHGQAKLGPGGVEEALKVLAAKKHLVNDVDSLAKAVHAIGSQQLKTRAADKRLLRTWLERPDSQIFKPDLKLRDRKIPERSLDHLLDVGGSSVGVALHLQQVEQEVVSKKRSPFQQVKDMTYAVAEICGKARDAALSSLKNAKSKAFSARARSNMRPNTVSFLESQGPLNDVLDAVEPLQKEQNRIKKKLFVPENESKQAQGRDQVRQHLLTNTRLLDDAKAPPTDNEVRGMIRASGGVNATIGLIDYAAYTLKPFSSAEAFVSSGIAQAHQLKDSTRREVRKILNEQRNRVVKATAGTGEAGKPRFTVADADKLLNLAGTGPETPALLRALQVKGTKPFDTLEELAQQLQEHQRLKRWRKADSKERMYNYFTAEVTPVLSTLGNLQKSISMQEVEELHDMVGSGDEAAAILKDLEVEGKKFDTFPELRDAMASKSQFRRGLVKQTLLSGDVLPAGTVIKPYEVDVFIQESGTADPAVITRAASLTNHATDLRKLAAIIEVSHATVQQIEPGESKQTPGHLMDLLKPASLVQVAEAMEDLPEEEEEEEAVDEDDANAPAVKLTPAAKLVRAVSLGHNPLVKKRMTVTEADNVLNAGGGLNRTLQMVQEARDEGRDFPDADNLVRHMSSEREKKNARILIDYLAEPSVFVLKDTAAPPTMQEAMDIVKEGKGLDKTLDLIEYHNKKGNEYDSANELLINLNSVLPEVERQKSQLGQVVNPSEQDKGLLPVAISEGDVEILYFDVRAGIETVGVATSLKEARKMFENQRELTKAMTKEYSSVQQDQRLGKVAMTEYLSSPACTVLSSKAKEKPPPRRDVHKLYALEGTLPGTVALLDKLERDNRVFDSVSELIAAAAEVQKATHDEVESYLRKDSQLLDQNARESEMKRVNNMVRDSQTGLETLDLLKELETRGSRVSTVEELVPLLIEAKLHKPAETTGSGSATAATAALMGELGTLEMKGRSALLQYLQSDDVDLLDKAGLTLDDMDIILHKGDGLTNTLDLCKYLNRLGERFANPPELANHLKDALPMRREVKDQIQHIITRPEYKGLLPDAPPATAPAELTSYAEAVTESLYNSAESGPTTAMELRLMIEEGKTFSDAAELASAVKTSSEKHQRKSRTEKKALKKFLEENQCPVFPVAGPIQLATSQVNDLYRVEQSGPGTAALLDALAEDMIVADGIDMLQQEALSLSRNRRKRLRDQLGLDTSCLNADRPPPPLTPSMNEVGRIAEESGTGPLSQLLVSSLEAKGVRVAETDDLTPLVRAERLTQAEAAEEAQAMAMEFLEAEEWAAVADIDNEATMLRAFLTLPTMAVCQDCKEMPEDLLHAILDTCGGLENVIANVDFLNEEGARFSDLKDLLKELKSRMDQGFEASARMAALLGENTDLDPMQVQEMVEELFEDVREKDMAPAAFLEVIEELPNFEGTPEQIKQVKQKIPKLARAERKARQALVVYLGQPACPIFSDEGNKEKVVDAQNVSSFFNIEGTSSGTGALINSLQYAGTKSDSTEQLVGEAKKVSGARVQECLQEMKKGPLFTKPTMPKPTLVLAHEFAKTSGAGPRAAAVLRGLAEQGAHPDTFQDLTKQAYSFIKEIDKQKDLPDHLRAAGFGPNPLEENLTAQSTPVPITDPDVQALIEYMSDPNCFLLSEHAQLHMNDAFNMLEAGGGLEQTLVALDFLAYDGKQYDTAANLIAAIPYGNMLKDTHQQDVRELLQDQDKKLLKDGMSITPKQVLQVIEEGLAGPETAHCLRDLAREKKHFEDIPSLTEAIRQVKQKKDEARKKDKASLASFLNSQGNGLLEQPPGSLPISEPDLNRLFAIEKSGAAVAALLDELIAEKEQITTIAKLAELGQTKATKSRVELAEFLAEPQIWHVSPGDTQKRRRQSLLTVAAMIERECEAGPAVLNHLKALLAEGMKFHNMDDLFEAIRSESKKKVKKNGARDALDHGDEIVSDLALLREALIAADSVLLPEAANPADVELLQLLQVVKSVENGVDLLGYLNNEGETYPSVKDLIPSLKDAKEKRAHVKARTKALVNNQLLPQQVRLDELALEDVYREVSAGPATAALLRGLVDAGMIYEDPEELLLALLQESQTAKLERQKEKNSIAFYLTSPECAVLSEKCKVETPPTRRDVHKLFALENSLPGTITLLNELEMQGKVFDDPSQLLDAAAKTSYKRRQELAAYLGDPSRSLFIGGPDRDLASDSGPYQVAELVEEGQAGTDTLALVKELEAVGARVDRTEELIPLVKAALLETPTATEANVAVAEVMGKLSDEEHQARAALLKYLKGDDVDLLHSTAGVTAEEMDAILAEGDGLSDVLDLCEYLNKEGRKFNTPLELASSLKDAGPARRLVKENLKKLLQEEEGKDGKGLASLLAGKDVGAAVEEVYVAAHAGPATSTEARKLAEEGRTFTSLAELAAAVEHKAIAKKRKQKMEKAALAKFLEEGRCEAFKPEHSAEVSPAQVNDLYRLEQSGRGCAALLDALAEAGVQAHSMAQLQQQAAAISKEKRQLLEQGLAKPDSVLNKGKVVPHALTGPQVAQLVEISETGPLALQALEALSQSGAQAKDLDALAPMLEEAAARLPKKAAGKFLAQEMAQAFQIQLEDVAQAKNLLSATATPLLDSSESVPDQDVLQLVQEYGGLEPIQQAFRRLSDSGHAFASFDELSVAMTAQERHAQDSVDQVLGALAAAIEDQPMLLNFETDKMTPEELERLREALGTLDARQVMAALAAGGNSFSNPEQLIEAFDKARKEADLETKALKRSLQSYLEHPKNPLLTDKANLEKKVASSDAQKMFEIAPGAGPAGALLNALEEAGEKYDSIPDLQAAAAKLAAARKRSLGKQLLDLRPKLNETTQRLDPHEFEKDSQAGVTSSELIKQLIDRPDTSFRSPKELLTEVDSLFAEKQQKDRKELPEPERKAGLGKSPLTKLADSVSSKDVEKMLDYFASPECEIMDFAEELDHAEVEHLLVENGGLVPTIMLCDYLNDRGEMFEAIPELVQRLPQARMDENKAITKLEDALKPIHAQIFEAPAEVKMGRQETEGLYRAIGAGPKTLARLSDVVGEKKVFKTPEELAEAVKEVHQAKNQEKRKDKQSLMIYLNRDDNPLFTPEANAKKQKNPLGPAEVNALFRQERSGLGTAALLDEMLKVGKKFDSPMDLLSQAENLSHKRRDSLQTYLADPLCKALKVNPAGPPIDSSRDAVVTLVEESQAGPNTQKHLEKLAAEGQRFANLDEMVPLVKPLAEVAQGPAGQACLDGRDESDDTEKLLDYFSQPDINLVDKVQDMPDEELAAILREGRGLENTIDLCNYLNKDFSEFSSLPELIPAMNSLSRPQRKEVKERMKAILNDPNIGLMTEPVTSADVDFIYRRVGAGPNSGALLRNLADSGQSFETLEDLAQGLLKLKKKADANNIQDKNSLMAYMQAPECPLFTQPPQNRDVDFGTPPQNRDVDFGTVSQLFRIEQSSRGTAALLDDLVKQNKRFSTLAEIIAACKKASEESRKQLGHYLNDAANPILDTRGQPLSKVKVDTLVEEAETGPTTLTVAQGFAKEHKGDKLESIEELIPLLKNFTQPAAGPATQSLPKPYQPTDTDVNMILDYFADPEVDLLSSIDNLTAADVLPIIREAGSVEEAVDLCEYLNAVGRTFDSGAALAHALEDAEPIRHKVKGEMLKILSDVKKQPLEMKLENLDNTVVDTVYAGAKAGPRTSQHLRHISYDLIKHPEKKKISTLEDLSSQIHIKDQVEKQQRIKEKQAMQSYLNSDEARGLLTIPEEGKVTFKDVNALYRIENSGKGTMALLNVMEAQGKQFAEFHELLEVGKEVSAKARSEALQYLQSEEAMELFIEAPRYATPKIADFVSLVEESACGPAIAMHMKQARFMDLKVEELSDLVPVFVDLHDAKLNATEVTPEERNAGLGGSASKSITAKASKMDVSEEDLEALMEYFSSENCQMMDDVKELEPEDLAHLLNEGNNLAETLALCSYLNYRNAVFKSVPELTEAIKGARAKSTSAKSQAKELLSSSNVLNGPGLTMKDFEALYTAAGAGPLILPLVHELVEENNRQFDSVEALGQELKKRYESLVAERRKHLEAVQSWLEKKHGGCRLWKGDPKAMGGVPMKYVRELFANEQSGYGTAALLHQLQVGGGDYASIQELLAAAKKKSQEKRQESLTKMIKQGPEVFRQSMPITADRIDQLVEDAEIGPALPGFISSLGMQKKFMTWPDLAVHVKRLYEPVRDPLNVLNEKKAQEKKETRITVQIDSEMLEKMANFLASKESKLVVKKESLNDRVLIWLLRESGGYQMTMTMLICMDELEATFADIAALTKALRFEIRIQNQVIEYLTDAGKDLLSQQLEPVPKKYVRGAQDKEHPTQEAVFKLWVRGRLGLATSAVLLELEAAGNKYKSVNELADAMEAVAKQSHIQLLTFLGDVTCTLIDSLHVTKHDLNQLMHCANGSGATTIKYLQELVKERQSFASMKDLSEAVRVLVGESQQAYSTLTRNIKISGGRQPAEPRPVMLEL